MREKKKIINTQMDLLNRFYVKWSNKLEISIK